MSVRARDAFFASGVRELRRAHLMTQKELAEASGVTQAVISRVESGEPTRASTIKKIASALAVKPEQLLKETSSSAA